jgi:hypothetical protein
VRNYTANNPTFNVLAELRALAQRPIVTLEDLRMVGRKQAAALAARLDVPASGVPARLTTLIPSIRIEYVDDVPAPGVTFWASHHWHMHISAVDPERRRVATILRELKRVIDHPLHARLPAISAHEWNALAVQFAEEVLATVLNQTKKGATL